MADPTDPAAPLPAAAAAPAAAFAPGELRASLARPHRALDILLAQRARLTATVRAHENLAMLAALMLACSIAFTVPFACVRGIPKAADVAVLFVGSTLLCFPSLQVFSSYLGATLTVAQNLVLALLVPSAAAMFCLGFFPIYWFLDLTMARDAAVNARDIAIGLLVVSLVLGLSHLNRCLFADSALAGLRSSWLLLVGWQVLLLFITYRMALVLGILG